MGTVVSINGHAADIELDEGRGVVYVANYTANRIEVVSMQSRVVQSSIRVERQPASLSLSPDGKYLIVGHLANFEEGGVPYSALTIIDLDSGEKKVHERDDRVLGAIFGMDGKALVVTTAEFLQYDPAADTFRTLATVAEVTTQALPVEAGTFPRDIIRASVGASGDRAWIYGTLEAGSADAVMHFSYDVRWESVRPSYWTASPPLGPRVVSVDQGGGAYLSGWALHHWQGFVLAQFPNATGEFSIGGHAFDRVHNLIYAQVDQTQPESEDERPTLVIADTDNLTIRERLLLPENLSGRGLVDSRGEYLYAASDSGLLIIPVGRLSETHRVAADMEDVFFLGSFCNNSPMSQTIEIRDPGQGATEFTLSTTMPGVTISPASGTTPATVTITLNPAVYASRTGTSEGLLQISSPSAVNVPVPVRILVNNHEPDQRGSIHNSPGKLVDVLSDPGRNRFYVLRQDKNEVLVYDSRSYNVIKSLRTGNTPWQMAMTADRRFLLVGADNSQVAHMFNLDTLEFVRYIVFPFGHYPRSIAASNNGILAAARDAGGEHKIDRVLLDVSLLCQISGHGCAIELPTLGIFKNEIDVDTMLTPTPSGQFIFAVQANGTVMLYDATLDTFVAARKDFDKLSGAYGAYSDKSYIVDNNVLNNSLVRVQTLESASGGSSGLAVWGGLTMRTTAPSSWTHGVIQKSVDGGAPGLTRIIEAPLLSEEDGGTVFTRTLAPVGDGLISLSTSGFTFLPWDYDAEVALPHIDSVVSRGTGSTFVAPGGLMTVLGSNLSPALAKSSGVPLPTTLGNSCLTINGVLVPLFMASPGSINAQVPVNVSGPATMVLRTPGGISNTYQFEIKPAAPAILSGKPEGFTEEMPLVIRWENGWPATLSNPIHEDDWLVIYATGLGAVAPRVDSGMPGKADPLSVAVLEPTVTLGGVPLEVCYAGLAPWGEDGVGIYQINVRVPSHGVPGGMEVPLTIKQGTTTATIYVRVVD